MPYANTSVWVFGMQLRAQGQSADEVDTERIKALRDGKLEIPQAVTVRYFLIGGRAENMFPLMVIKRDSPVTPISESASGIRAPRVN